MKPIENKSRHPRVDWLDDAKPIGTVGGTPLVLIGHDQDSDDAIVSSDRNNDPYFAVPLSELTTHSQDPIDITGDLTRAKS